MEDVKSWWQSRTVWGAIIAIAAPVVGRFLKVEIDDTTQTAIVDAVVAFVASGGGLLALYGRLKATKEIGKPQQ